MQTYICKCGRTFEKSSKADTTGYILKDYSPQHECYGCPYIVIERDWITHEIVKQECRATPHITYATRCDIGTDDKDYSMCHLYSLDLAFVRRVMRFVNTLDGAAKGENINCIPDEWRAADFGKCYVFKDCCGLAIFPLYFQKNAKGTEARRAVMEQFFTLDGRRRNLSEADEKEIILQRIEIAKENARSEIYKSTASICSTCVNNGECVPKITDTCIAYEKASEEMKEEKEMTTAFDLGAMLSTPPANPQYAAAAELNAEIMNCAREAQENLYRMAMGFKRMRDEKLYMALGYQSFGEYCEREAGMKRQNVYRYIEVVEKLPNDLSHRCDKIGMTKLQLLTTLSDEERTEIIESTDLENTSVRELRERIKELEREKDDLHAECILTDTKRKSEKEQLEKRINALTKAREITQKDIDKLSEEKSELEKQIAKLESRPIEIAVQENDSDKKEISRLKAEIARLEAEAAKPVDNTSIEFEMKLKAAKSAVQAVCLCALNSGDTLLQRKAYSQLTELIKVFENHQQ